MTIDESQQDIIDQFADIDDWATLCRHSPSN